MENDWPHPGVGRFPAGSSCDLDGAAVIVGCDMSSGSLKPRVGRIYSAEEWARVGDDVMAFVNSPSFAPLASSG